MIEVLTDRKVPSALYSRRLVELGGTNLYGEPRFILFWGQTFTIKRGWQTWTDHARSPHGISIGSYEVLHGNNVPAWHLSQWKPCSIYGSPLDWDSSLLGPYPSMGFYEIIQPFYRRELISGRFLKLHVMPIDSQTFPYIELMVQIILNHEGDSKMKRESAFAEKREREEKELTNHLADLLHAALPEWTDARNYARQSTTKSLVQAKMEQIERNQKNVLRFLRQRPKRTSVFAGGSNGKG